MRTRLLGDDEFRATAAAGMRLTPVADAAPIDVWPYVDAVPARDLAGHQLGERTVAQVARSHDSRYDHLLIATRTRDVFLVVVGDIRQGAVIGHHLLDLPALYGLPKR